jgi:hypothetical protein
MTTTLAGIFSTQERAVRGDFEQGYERHRSMNERLRIGRLPSRALAESSEEQPRVLSPLPQEFLEIAVAGGSYSTRTKQDARSVLSQALEMTVTFHPGTHERRYEDVLEVATRPMFLDEASILSLSHVGSSTVFLVSSSTVSNLQLLRPEAHSLLSTTTAETMSSALALTAFQQGANEVFEYGSESKLARDLSALIVANGPAAVRGIQIALTSPTTTDETACEALRHLGALNDLRTRMDRLRLLAKHLRSDSPRRRYAAALGLADMNTADAIELLRAAIEYEPLEELKARFRRFVTLLGS